jgi:hypothetical protein
MSDNVIVINEFGGELEQRTSKSGKVRHTIRIKSEPVIVNMDPKALGQPVAAAIVHHLREKIRGVTALAAPATIKARQVAAKAFAAGKPWAVKRYSGGKTGSTPPNQSNKALNDSGRMANSITGNASSDGHWRINVAANRLNAEMGNLERIWRRVTELVPEFGDPKRLLENDVLRKAIEQAQRNMLRKAQMSTGELQKQLIGSVLGLVQQVGDVIGV